MKKTLFVALLACLTLMLASCSKEKSLDGTTWKCSISDTEESSDYGIQGTLTTTLDFTMKFNNATQGTLSTMFSATITTPDGQTIPVPLPDQDEESNNFAYTFDGKNGTITGEGTTESYSFFYTKRDNTITLEDAIDLSDITGSDSTDTAPKIDLVFSEVK